MTVWQVISRKDQAQYWHRTEQAHCYIPVDALSKKFKESSFGKKLDEEISEAFVKSQSHINSISSSVYSLSKWTLFKACMSRELLLMKRNSFVYIFKSVQVILSLFISSITIFLFKQYNFLRNGTFLPQEIVGK